MTARATSGDESTSPTPSIALVRADADDEVVLAAVRDRAVEAGCRTTIASTSVIFIVMLSME